MFFVDYELSSWKYQDNKQNFSKYVKYITGELPLPDDCDIIIKKGFVDTLEEKGMGSSRGGEWRPKKEEDERFLGKPGEVKRTFVSQGYWKLTKIGDDGRAVMERHLTDHGCPQKHSFPHDHKIDWSNGYPKPQKAINYYDDEIPEFKKYEGENIVYIDRDKFADYAFESIDDFKWCMTCGGEVNFVWNDKEFGVFSQLQKTENSPVQMFIGPTDKTAKTYGDKYPEVWCDTPDEILEYVIDGDKLRDIITKVLVTDRTI